MGVRSRRLSVQGLELVKKKWNDMTLDIYELIEKVEKIDPKARVTSASTVNRFLAGKPIAFRGFVALCQAIEVDWEEVVDKEVGEVGEVRPNLGENIKLDYTLTNHTDSIGAIAISPSEGKLASGSYDGTITIWDLQKQKVYFSLNYHDKDVSSVVFSSDKELISGSYDGTIKIFNLQTRKVKWTLPQESESNVYPIESISLSQDGKYLFVSSYDSEQITIWYLPEREKIGSLHKHKHGIMCLAATSDSHFLVSGGKDGRIMVWETSSNEQLLNNNNEPRQSFPASDNSVQHLDWVTSLAITPDNKTLASGAKDGVISLWDLNTGTCIKKVNAHSTAILSLAFIREGQILASASFDNTIKLHDWDKNNCIQTLEKHSVYTQSLIFSKKNETLFSSNKNGEIKAWKVY
ncbi:MAG: WD40 repeat domain-containing protein [Crocosphaera sp.]|uniref:WD40 repeat domain-containing protein n=1 Tax=Crocosphaera sp. TaxID=2729996 RepID=UPI0025864D87|nr:WD40 repeat domain-containing protein [Crocosphaera sp.]MCH2228072.1 WD40 repeat domain-containing protein [Candidatus Caenarcaniphilales bacterium]MCH2245382.1 WD40 repeat domain-containing protein [Crocosphaera sp.]